MVYLFCPKCGNLLGVEEGNERMQFACSTCPYIHPVRQKIVGALYPKLKAVDEVLGGPGAWENAQITDAKCPKCQHDRAHFMELQTRSGDEPMTLFYRCAQCSNRWNE